MDDAEATHGNAQQHIILPQRRERQHGAQYGHQLRLQEVSLSFIGTVDKIAVAQTGSDKGEPVLFHKAPHVQLMEKEVPVFHGAMESPHHFQRGEVRHQTIRKRP